MRNFLDLSPEIQNKHTIKPEEFLNITFSSNANDPVAYKDEDSLKFFFKIFAETQASPNYKKNLNDFFLKDSEGKIKSALKNRSFMEYVVSEALNNDNFKLINKIITSIDNKDHLEILNTLLEKKIPDMTDLEMPKKLSAITMEAKFDKGENILHIMASQKNLQETYLKDFEEISAQYKNADFITHLLDSKNAEGKTPLDIARENNNKVFSDSFDRKPYTILSELKNCQNLIQEKVEKRSCAVM